MKLLLDANLSDRIIPRILDLYPHSMHVKMVGLANADDGVIWQYARDHGFVLVSKDSDFHQRSLVFGHPPKFIFLRVGNAQTRQVTELLISNFNSVAAFDADPGSSILILS